MKTRKQLWWEYLCLIVFLSIKNSACQYILCNEFFSPLQIQTLGSDVGIIQVPKSGPQYARNQACEWNIKTNMNGFVIRLDVTKCLLQGRDIHGECSNDYVDVFDIVNNNTNLLGRFCGQDNWMSYLTTSNKMIVRFCSDSIIELGGFMAFYQAVPKGPSNAEIEEQHKAVLNLAIGIPFGILAIIVIIITAVFIGKHYRRKKEAAQQTRTTSAAQNNPRPDGGFPGRYQSTGIPHFSGNQSLNHSDNVWSSDLGPYMGNSPLQVALPRDPVQGSSRGRSVTPPPAYDSIDFSQSEVGLYGTPLTPPPYEVIAKQNMGLGE